MSSIGVLDSEHLDAMLVPQIILLKVKDSYDSVFPLGVFHLGETRED